MTLVRSEDVDQKLREILERAAEVGREAEAAALRAGLEVRRLPTKPDIGDRLFDELREVLEEEVFVARPASGEAVIEAREEEREIAKRALAHLKLSQLRAIADDRGLARSGTLDEVLERIVRFYKVDREAIARLVVSYETEPPPERRFTTRIFHIWAPPDDLAAVGARVSLFAGRYIRTGIARWFVIEDVQALPSLVLDGTYRFYRADAEVEGEEYTLRADRDSARAQLTLRPGEAMTEVEARRDGESRAIMAAFERASNLRWRTDLPVSHSPTDGALAVWDPRTVFMVDLLNARFNSNAVEIFNLSVANFQMRGESAGEEAVTAEPAVRAVRFQGRHLLDSRPACELIVSGQGLVELAMIVRYRANATEDYLLPLTLRLERDHAVIATGFGDHPMSAARTLHTLVVRSVKKAFGAGLADVASLRRLADDIRQRADSEGRVPRATLFSPPQPSDDPAPDNGAAHAPADG